MLTIHKIHKKYGGNVCRQCINKAFGIHLNHTDCKYDLLYPGKCPGCGEMKNIVTGLRMSGRFKK